MYKRQDQELIAFSSQAGAVLALDFEAEEREQTAKITIGRGAKKRTAQLNGVDQPAASSLIGKFCAVVFSPDHLSLVKEGPSMRRKFLDAALCQRKPAYARLLSQYSRTLAQRNTLLKDISLSLIHILVDLLLPFFLPEDFFALFCGSAFFCDAGRPPIFLGPSGKAIIFNFFSSISLKAIRAASSLAIMVSAL